MNDIPSLDNLINAMKCEEWKDSVCKECPYGYQFYDDHGDTYFWTCNSNKIDKDALFYLGLYQFLIKEKEKENGRV